MGTTRLKAWTHCMAPAVSRSSPSGICLDRLRGYVGAQVGLRDQSLFFLAIL
jgi:hypothetical protein